MGTDRPKESHAPAPYTHLLNPGADLLRVASSGFPNPLELRAEPDGSLRGVMMLFVLLYCHTADRVAASAPLVLGPSCSRPLMFSAPHVLGPSCSRPLVFSAPRVLGPSCPRPLVSSAPRVLGPSCPRPLVFSAPHVLCGFLPLLFFTFADQS